LFRLFDSTCCAAERGFCRAEDVDATEIVFTRAGHFVRRIGSHEVAHEPGTMSLFRAGDSYRVRHPVGDGDHCLVMTPRGAAMERLESTTKRVDREAHGLPRAASYLVARLAAAANHRCRDPLAIEEAAATLFAFAIERLSFESTPRPRCIASHRLLATRARERLAATYRTNDDLSSIAAALGCSPFHLCRVFRAVTGSTLSQHRLGLRLLAALDAIEAGATDLTDLAHDLGFADHAHLSNSFRKAFGMPPSRVRHPPSRAELRVASNRLQAEIAGCN
jgi:AraC family transcriptional regulator